MEGGKVVKRVAQSYTPHQGEENLNVSSLLLPTCPDWPLWAGRNKGKLLWKCFPLLGAPAKASGKDVFSNSFNHARFCQGVRNLISQIFRKFKLQPTKSNKRWLYDMRKQSNQQYFVRPPALYSICLFSLQQFFGNRSFCCLLPGSNRWRRHSQYQRDE